MRRLRPADEQGSRQGNPEGEAQGEGGHAGVDRRPDGQPQSFGPAATASASTPGRGSGAAGGGGGGSQHVTSSLLGPLASSPATAALGQGLLGGGVGQGGEGPLQVNAFWSPEAKKLVGSNQATPVGTAERRSRETDAVEALRQRLLQERSRCFNRNFRG